MLKGASYIAFWKFSKSQDGENFPSPRIVKNFQQQIYKKFQQQIFKRFQQQIFRNFQQQIFKNFQKFSTAEFCYQQRWQKLIQYQNEKQCIAEASENFLSTRIWQKAGRGGTSLSPAILSKGKSWGLGSGGSRFGLRALFLCLCLWVRVPGSRGFRAPAHQSSKGGKVEQSQTQTLTTCLADKTNHPVERLSLNRSQCGSCSTKYDTSAGT